MANGRTVKVFTQTNILIIHDYVGDISAQGGHIHIFNDLHISGR